MPALSPYATVDFFGRDAPAHVPAEATEDVARLRAYETYEDLYFNQPAIFEVPVQVEGANMLYRRLVPGARSIVEAINRYLGRGLTFSADAAPQSVAVGATTPDTQAALQDERVSTVLGALEALFKREEFSTKFLSLKRWMLIRGDAILHVTADPAKPAGSRIRIVELAANTYFALEDPADSERVNGCYLVNIVKDDAGDNIAARLEYRRAVDDTLGVPLGSIFVKLGFFELDGWDDRRDPAELKPVDPPARYTDGDRFVALLEGQALPDGITSIPVYHFRNRRRGGSLYGISAVQGIETLIVGVNQTATDEEVSVALAGIGVYSTDSSRPTNDEGQPVDWIIAPASIVELESGKTLSRVQGVTSVQPMQDHMNMMVSAARESSGVPDIAVGRVEGNAVASGVALSIQMAPMVAKAEETEEELKTKLDQFLHDLITMWLPTHESETFQVQEGVEVEVEFADPLPKNEAEIVQRAVDLVTAKIVSAEWARGYLAEQLGLNFSASEGAAIAAEGAALLDATGARMDAALADPAVEVGL